MAIATANTHPIWDPTWAKAIVQERYADALALGAEITRYGADLLQRALASAPDDRGHHVLLIVLFRQLLVAFDACVFSLENASEHGLNVQARLVMESRWSLLLGLRDPAKWGRHLYVASRRHQRLLLRRAIPGTPECQAYSSARDLMGDAAAALPPGGVSEQESFVAAVDEILAAQDLSPIDRLFDEWLGDRRSRGLEARWFYDGPNPGAAGLISIFNLATEVGCQGEYLSIYGWSSLHVHGGDTSTHFHHDDIGVAIAPIRTPGSLRHPYFLASSMTADCYRLVIQAYRDGELKQFLKQHLTQWRLRLEAMPVIDLSLGNSASAA